MGVISRFPEFRLLPPTPSELPPPAATSKPDIFQQQQHSLEQASIEDYFTQSKYYSNVSEGLQAALFPVAPPPPGSVQPVDQPGPSGLQALKGKTSAKLKKRKPDRVSSHKKSHTCPVCHKSFATGEKFTKHYQSHSGSSQFKCEHCKKSFSSKFKLVRHALIHSDKKPFSCTVCERTFHRKDHLKNHIKVHSPTKKLYECEKPGCNKQYTSLLSYRKHLADHAAEEGNLTCQICFVAFQTKEEILYHLKIHAGSRTVKNPNEKKYLCEYCDRRFFTKKDVRRHLVVHTGMRDFLCQFCPQRFGRKDHLVRHIKKSHHRQYSLGEPCAVKSETSRTETVTGDVGSSSRSSEVAAPPPPPPPPDKTAFEDYEGLRRSVKTEQADADPGGGFKAEDLGLEGVKTIFEEESLAPLDEEELFLSSQSTQSELKEICSEIFKRIGEDPSAGPPLVLEQRPAHEMVVNDPEGHILDPQIFNLLQQSDDNKLPLPGFSQTFQPPPPP